MLVLGIETSCDETAVALLDHTAGSQPKILCERISSQSEIHKRYGGVVPELASREHLANVPLILDSVLVDAGVSLNDVSVIGVTRGPGLKGCLLVGLAFAQGLARATGKTLLGVNHIEGHVLAAFLDNPELTLPYLALIASGGHTELVEVRGLGKYKILARTIDDAAGEAFDKSANLLGFEYPGAVPLTKLADSVTATRFSLPKVMRDSEGFSFSGLKTAISLLIRDNESALSDEKIKAEIAFAIQESIVDALCFKLEQAIKRTRVSRVVISGGVAANRRLRERVQELKRVQTYLPELKHCVDNGAMIAYVAALRAERGESFQAREQVLPRWPVEQCLS